MLQPLETVVETLINGAQSLRELLYPFALGNLTRIDIISDTVAGAGGATFDVLLNGATIFPGGGGRPVIAAGATVGSVTGLATAVARFDKLRVTCASAPAGGIGGKLYILLTFDDGVSTGGGVLAGDVTGAAGANTVEKIRNRLVDPMTVTLEELKWDEYITWVSQFHLGDSSGFDATGANGFIQSNQTYWWTAGADGSRISAPGDEVIFWFTPVSRTAGGNYGLGAQAVNPGAQGDDINLRWHIKGDDSGTAAVWENTGTGGAVKTAYFAVPSVGTKFTIKVGADGSVKYYMDTGAGDVLKYTSTIPAATVKSWALRAQVSLGYYGGNAPEAPNSNGYQGCNTSHIRIASQNVDPVPDGAGLYWSVALQKFEAALRLAGLDIVGDPTDGATLIYVASANHFEWRVIAPAVISGASEEDIAWSGLTGHTSVGTANKLQTSADWDGVTRNGARAAQTVQAIGGYVKVTVGAPAQSTRYLGLRNSAADHIASNFSPYRIQVRLDGTFNIIENGVDLLTGTAYAGGDVLEFRAIDSSGAKIAVYKNNVQIQVFATAPTFPLIFDVELPFGGQDLQLGKIKRTA